MIAPASRKLGKYEILQKLGRGGMADVYLAYDTALSYQVALKLIEHAPDTDTRDFIDAERRGSILQAHLAAVNEHVARIYESGDVDGFFYVAMEYVDGQDLSDLLRRGRVEVEFAVDVARAVAQTLDSAHNLQVAIDGKEFHGIVHGDIKPKNIRINSRGEVRVLDFGIAKALSLSRRLTRNEFGSVPYGSPERLEYGEVNVLSDLWSLAVMLYEMITGTQPYQADTTEHLERIIRSRVPPPAPPDPCPEPLRRILMKAMAPDPEVRYQTAKEIDDDLAAFRNGGTVRAVEEDLEATRRTVRRESDDDTRRTVADDETRRTGAEPATTRAQLHYGQWPPARTRRQLPAWARRGMLGLVLIFAVWAGWALVSDMILYKRGQRLARQIDAGQVTDPTETWSRWTEVANGNPMSVWLAKPRKAVSQRLAAAATRIIDSYREGDIVSESGWKNARDELAHAISLQSDNTLMGKLRLTEGHLARIAGGAHKSTVEYNQAVDKFNQAQKLLPGSPDPQLGLARVYVYGLKDFDKADEALQRAQQLGYNWGKREKAQLADGHKDRAEKLFWDSRNVRGLPQEKDEILRAKSDYERALGLYKEIIPWGNASANAASVERDLESVNSRLQQIDQDEHGPLVNLPRSIPDRVKTVLEDIWKLRNLGQKDKDHQP
jgi:tetratricopeptide (TPR) repeat protein